MTALPFTGIKVGGNKDATMQTMRKTNLGYCDFLSGQGLFRFALLLSLPIVLCQLKLMNQITLGNDEDITNRPTTFLKSILSERATTITTGDINNSTKIKYHNCPFKDSSIVESVYVYPHPGSPEWKGDILSDYTRQGSNFSGRNGIEEYPWIANDLHCKINGIGPYEINSQLVQYNQELLVRDIITHRDSCLRTYDPEKATLFYVPYLASAEFHNGSLFNGESSRSIYGKAIQDIITEEKYESWETKFGLTSKYWKRRNGSDHILVFGEPMHGLWHPKSRRGNFHFLHSQFQTHAPIVISNELSKTFVDMYPKCAQKNILMPYPNTNGRWFNGKIDNETTTMMANRMKIRELSHSSAAIQSELELEGRSEQNKQQQEETAPNGTNTSPLRILGYYYKGGNHGTCTKLRRSMTDEFQCSPSGKMVKKYKEEIGNYAYGYRHATFCPCPGGDSPSAKRNFDALLAGCIPIIISEDFVWPFTVEFDRSSNHHNSSRNGGKTALLNPDDFSIRLRAGDHEDSKFDSPKTCKPITMDNTTGNHRNSSLQSILEAISSDELARLRRGVTLAADAYSYYKKYPDLPDNPLREGVLPEGGAAYALVRALEERASGALWDACQREMEDKDIRKDSVKQFKC
jgi:hypothetical protein